MTPEDRREYAAALRMSGHTLQEIGEWLGVTRERARQLCLGRTPRMLNQSRQVDPVKVMQVARRATSLHAVAKETGWGVGRIKQALSELGVLPALVRLWAWRRGTVQSRRIAELQHAARMLGRTPRTKDMLAHLAGLCSPSAYTYAFGSIRKAQTAAGLPFNRVGGGRKGQRQTHCKRGHEMTAENTYQHGNHRFCLACKKAGQKRRYHAAQLVGHGSDQQGK